ncbi:MAG: DUF1385 domain-containing protein [Clostridiales Family XIII bacterium]|jgi:uncharacterized protein YqhQ|nr:DUF1385 domain-containing protein [Clostridiales Family XIII bacterium]
MDFSKIFIKDARPTKIGGQAVLEGIMMKGEDRTAVVVRLEDERMHIKTERLAPAGRASRIPIVRGVVNFASMLMLGMRTLMYSAEVLEKYAPADDDSPDSRDKPENDNDGGASPFGAAMIFAVLIAVAFVVGVFIVVPTVAVNWFQGFTENAVALNLFEGVLRIALFVAYIVCISRMKDIRTTFEYHGAEHETIHCYESGLPLTPENADSFETLHPRCGTSFLMFVMIIALLLFSLLGWPSLLYRVLSRIIFIPLIAGLSYELLRYAGRADNAFVRVMSVPGLLLQKLTTRKPTHDQLVVAIAALKAVLVPQDTEEYEGFCDEDGALLPEEPHADDAPLAE